MKGNAHSPSVHPATPSNGGFLQPTSQGTDFHQADCSYSATTPRTLLFYHGAAIGHWRGVFAEPMRVLASGGLEEPLKIGFTGP